jgi:hypothetical protein
VSWTVTPTYVGPNWEIYRAVTDNPADTSVVVPHTLDEAPIVYLLTPHNLTAVEAQFWIDTVTPASVTLNKSAGLGLNADVCLHLSTLRHPH